MTMLTNTDNDLSMDTATQGESTFSKRRRMALTYLRANGVGLATEAAINFVAPYLIFSWAKPHWGDVDALIASSAPPILWSLVEFARRRRVDALSILVLSGIALSLLAYAGGGGVRMLQLREKLVTALIGCIFLGSAIIRKPLIYQLARATLARRGSAELSGFEALRDNPFFRRTMTVMTLVWGSRTRGRSGCFRRPGVHHERQGVPDCRADRRQQHDGRPRSVDLLVQPRSTP